MGRGTGVRIASATSIEITFEYKGVRCREKLKLTPNAANLKHAHGLKATVEHEIAVGSFDYGVRFPHSKRAKRLAKVPANIVTVGELLTEWLGSVQKSLEPETYELYSRYIRTTWRAELLSLWLAGHYQFGPKTIEELLELHLATVQRLLPYNVMALEARKP